VTARSTGARTGAVPAPAARSSTRAPAARSTPSRPELRLVAGENPARPRRPLPAASYRRAPFVLLVVALLVGTTLGLLVLNTAIAVDSLKATALRSANAQRSQEVQRLQQQVITAGTPEQVAADATRAGLVPAGQPGFLVIGPDGRSTLRGTPEPAPRPTAATPTAAAKKATPAAAKPSTPAPAATTPAPVGH
jgi:hypothetical protein